MPPHGPLDNAADHIEAEWYDNPTQEQEHDPELGVRHEIAKAIGLIRSVVDETQEGDDNAV